MPVVPEEHLFEMARTGNFEALKGCISKEIVNKPISYDGRSLLMVAARKGHISIVKWLIEDLGATVDYRNEDGDTALFSPAALGNTECLKFLLKHGADPNIQNLDNNFPLLLSAYYGHYQCCKILIEHNADIQMTGYQGQKPAEVAKERKHSNIQTLLELPLSKL